MKQHLALFVASGCYLGLIPGAPGTYASLAATLAFYGVYRIYSRILPELHLSAVCLISAIGMIASSAVARRENQEDPRKIVIDEIAGQLLAFAWIPVTPWTLLFGFLLFRAFDIWKPFPIRRLEHLPDGVGIIADDLLAGVYACLVLHLMLRIVTSLK